jgi:hypothetical protein
MNPIIEVSGIRFEETRISNVQDKRVFASINRSDISKLDFRWGILSQRPVLQVILGVVLSLFGLSVVRFIYMWFTYGGTAFDYQIMLVLLLPGGVWIIVDALKVGYYLSIEQRSGSKNKMTFQEKQNQISLEELSRQLRSKLNYEVRILSKEETKAMTMQ